MRRRSISAAAGRARPSRSPRATASNGTATRSATSPTATPWRVRATTRSSATGSSPGTGQHPAAALRRVEQQCAVVVDASTDADDLVCLAEDAHWQISKGIALLPRGAQRGKACCGVEIEQMMELRQEQPEQPAWPGRRGKAGLPGPARKGRHFTRFAPAPPAADAGWGAVSARGCGIFHRFFPEISRNVFNITRFPRFFR